MRSLRTQLSLAIVFVVLVTVALISILSNYLIHEQFEAYITKQQKTRAENIAENIGQYYNGLTNAWDLVSIHALSMYSLYDGYIIRVYDNKGASVWDAESHDMRICQQIMGEISKQMSAHGESGAFTSQSYELTQNEQKIGSMTIKYYAPFFLSESDFSFLSALNAILLTIGALSLVFSFMTGWFLARRITRPIRKTADVARQIAEGRYNVQFESQTKTRELHDLVSALNHLADALGRQERLRKQLTADVAHELRTPLTTLSSHLEAMIEHVWEPTPKRLKSCYEETQRLEMLVADLENLAKIESENLKLNKSRVDLLEIVQIAGENLETEASKKNLSLSIVGVSSFVNADKERMSQVLANLFSNAIKYTPAGGHICAEVTDDAQNGIIRVKDNGIGIPEKELPLVFERFYRTDKSRARKTGGTGIGLTIVKSIVTAHNGTVTADSHTERGSCFTVTIPKK
ncbi:MAG: HAMP domain-containing histidine kinase [Syntrophomonadaceae bacterium]|jgi:signal transduction histidine kinase/uncharacterized protein (UPF0333 family)|nr:HAMP domain-containing histidine kinase [Syntrophomonadaceae bacterium]